MLILTRKIGQIITLGDDIRLTALDVQGCQVRLGFKAPKEAGIHRQEIYDRIQVKSPCFDGRIN